VLYEDVILPLNRVGVVPIGTGTSTSALPYPPWMDSE